MDRTGLRLDPLDTLFFRDGRPFDAASRASTGLPQPQPLAGAVRTYLLARHGLDLDAFARQRRQKPDADVRDVLRRLGAPGWVLVLRFRGPWLALAGEQDVEPLLPVPVTLARDGRTKKWHRADPLQGQLPGWDHPRLRPVWRRGAPDAKHPGGYLTKAGIEKFLLAGGLPEDDDWLRADDLFGFDDRTGVEIDAGTLTAVEGRIYDIRLLALRPKVERDGPHRGKRVCLYAELLGLPDGEEFADPLPLGGEGRCARIHKVEPADWTQREPDGGRGLWLLASPAFLPGPEPLPAVQEPARLVAAASGSPVAVSGWDVARGGPRPVRFAVPAGSVYFVDGTFNPPQNSLCTDPEQVAQGWGHILRGTWDDA
jgi:CRISPR-associated protein Cmr3